MDSRTRTRTATQQNKNFFSTAACLAREKTENHCLEKKEENRHQIPTDLKGNLAFDSFVKMIKTFVLESKKSFCIQTVQ